MHKVYDAWRQTGRTCCVRLAPDVLMNVKLTRDTPSVSTHSRRTSETPQRGVKCRQSSGRSGTWRPPAPNNVNRTALLSTLGTIVFCKQGRSAITHVPHLTRARRSYAHARIRGVCDDNYSHVDFPMLFTSSPLWWLHWTSDMRDSKLRDNIWPRTVVCSWSSASPASGRHDTDHCSRKLPRAQLKENVAFATHLWWAMWTTQSAFIPQSRKWSTSKCYIPTNYLESLKFHGN